MLTFPDRSFTRHDAHVPERHALSMKMPASSATSRMVASTAAGALAPEAGKRIGRPVAVERALFAVGSRVTVPNASVLTWVSGTPNPRSAALTASIMDGGPQICGRRAAIFGTTDVSNAE